MKIGIVGGGAAGLAAAVTACQLGAEVFLLEQTDRVGKKILSTGNGKCNFTNRRMGAEFYHSETADLLSFFVSQDSVAQVLDFFSGLGMLYREKNGGYYPYSEQAQTVLDVLRFALEGYGEQVKVCTGCRVEKVEPLKDGRVSLEIKNSCPETKASHPENRKSHPETHAFPSRLTVDRVILACGGKAAPKTGSDGSGYDLLRRLGLSCTPVAPALVQLRCQERDFAAVAGVRTQAIVRLFVDGSPVDEQAGEVQLTDYGISGIPVFQLSRHASLAVSRGQKVTAGLDVLPEVSEKQWTDILLTRKKQWGERTMEQFCSGLLHKKLCALFLKKCNIRPNQRADSVSDAQIRQLAHLCKDWQVTVERPNGFDMAQVCAGGLSLKEIRRDFSLKKYPQIYAAGELLDVDGLCGGYNLHWAWISGITAAKSAAAGKERSNGLKECSNGFQKCADADEKRRSDKT
ncbi:MAG: aminoacetone oxidase family FAD-binding enzyme [Lachnospiraceae bacterium]|nr:aminoacetone oxidase family FAD-binding enzyme [Lachnospiraceae bacterium]